MFGLCSSGKKTSCGQSKPKKSACGKKSCKPGKVTRNAFFNFLREFRVKHCDWPVTKIAVEGAKCWCKMSPCDRKKYLDMARCAPKMKRRRKHKRGGSCGRKASHRRPKRRCG
ncbi:protamine-like [Coccinella septempunctata]|uniref:protamine-like n=1 Tax=Coccinella septempunctata TaxID=41139 RepID=UPI001D070A90|nr:protamine-like [Coccinella septempunctata]